jgi:hypothetical protein
MVADLLEEAQRPCDAADMIGRWLGPLHSCTLVVAGLQS